MPWRKRYVMYGLMLILILNPALGETRFSRDSKNYENMLSPISSPDSKSSPVRLFVKEWIAQWDPLYSTWFYFNINTGQYLDMLCEKI